MDELFYEAFCSLPRGGPGNAESTRRAISLVNNLPFSPKILDVGCGTGLQTAELAKAFHVEITALDNYAPSGEAVIQNAEKAGVSPFVKFVLGDMFKMDFPDESFDLLWSEGAIFIVGFENGLRDWNKFLKPGGYMAVSEMSLLKSDIPDEVKDYWNIMYPAIKDLDGNIKTIESAGYSIVDHFILPEEAWWDDFYNPLQDKINFMRNKYKNDAKANNLLDEFQTEIEMYRKYSDCYGYIFYIMQKEQ